MNNITKQDFVDALRSGKYEQGRGRLRMTPHNRLGPPLYCCLGVLCDLVDPDGWKENQYGPTFPIEGIHNGATAYPHKTVLDAVPWFRLVTEYGHDPVASAFTKLAEMNDSGDWTFEAIALWVEENM